MLNFIVTTDSGCDLPYSLLQEREIIPFPIEYEIDGKVIADTMLHEDCKKFYDSMREGAVPKTSQINVMQFVDFWRPLTAKGLPIVHISLGSGISGTYSNGLAAMDILKEQGQICLGCGISGTYSNGAVAAGLLKKENPEAKIFLVDSTLASVGYGMLSLIAADMRDNGKTPEECVNWLNAHKAEINTYYTTSDLTYLYRSGRVSRTGMIIAHALDINPILNLDLEGHLIVQEKIRGHKKTIRRIQEIISELVADPGGQTLYICHSDIPEEAREFGDALKEKIEFKDVYYTYIGTTIGAHAGPGLMAAFFFGKPRTMKGYKGK